MCSRGSVEPSEVLNILTGKSPPGRWTRLQERVEPKHSSTGVRNVKRFAPQYWELSAFYLSTLNCVEPCDNSEVCLTMSLLIY